MISEFDNKLNYLKEHTCLPNNPDYERINKFLADTNWEILKRSERNNK